MTQKETWFIVLEHDGEQGLGECGLLRGLSYDDHTDYEEKLKWLCDNINLDRAILLESLEDFPSIKFGLEQALLSLKSKNLFHLYESDFIDNEKPIPINGLVWMGDKAFMFNQIKQKLREGFPCIKMKIGAIDFDTEIALLQTIRKEFSKNEIELRVDANGAFNPKNALDKLGRLSELEIHSIEQPIKQGQWDEMAALCENSPIPIALDEELIGIQDVTKQQRLIQTIQPQYIILKPSLVGGFENSERWINLAEHNQCGWWVTSALESNVGLNAIAQWTATLDADMPQGLGTGSLFTNNFESPLQVTDGQLFYRKGVSWPNDLIQTICT